MAFDFYDKENNVWIGDPSCPNCKTRYDEIDYEFQICTVCNHNNSVSKSDVKPAAKKEVTVDENQLEFELTEWDIEQIERLANGGNKNAGMIVVTKTGLSGRTYSHEDYINGKIIVHVENGKLLCVPETLTLKGFID